MYYVYILARPDGRPFYVGKGKDDRLFAHEREARRGVRSHKCNVIRKIWRTGGEVQRYTVFTTEEETEAFAYEQTLIAMFGRETLTNQSDGGAGFTGMKRTWAKHRQRWMRTFRSPEYRAACSARNKQIWSDEGRRALASKRSKQRWSDPEIAARMRDAIKAAIQQDWDQSFERKQQLSQWSRERWADPDTRAQMIATLNTPEVRAKIREGVSAYWTEEKRQEAAERSRRRWTDPEYRQKALSMARSQESRARSSATMQRLQQDPDFVERQRASARLTGPVNIKATHTEEAKAKMRVAARAPERRQKLAEAARERWANPEFREKALQKLALARKATRRRDPLHDEAGLQSD